MSPSFVVRFRSVGDADLRWAAELGQKHQKPAVMLFRHGEGEDAVQRVQLRDLEHVDQAAKAMAEVGLSDAVYDPVGGDLRFAMTGSVDLAQVQAVADAICGRLLPEEVGRLILLTADHYAGYTSIVPEGTIHVVTMTIGGSTSLSGGSSACSAPTPATRMSMSFWRRSTRGCRTPNPRGAGKPAWAISARRPGGRRGPCR